jgi:hypothetical protein
MLINPTVVILESPIPIWSRDLNRYSGARDDHKPAFAGTVAPDEPDDFTLADLKANVL